MESIVEDIIRSGRFKRLIENILVEDAKRITGLNRVELVIIYYLYREEDRNTLTAISAYLQMNKGHISTTLEGLGRKGYLTCQRDPEDHRYVRYQITGQARSAVADMDRLWAEMSERIVQDIKREDLAVFHQVAGQIEGNIGQMLEEFEREGNLT